MEATETLATEIMGMGQVPIRGAKTAMVTEISAIAMAAQVAKTETTTVGDDKLD